MFIEGNFHKNRKCPSEMGLNDNKSGKELLVKV